MDAENAEKSRERGGDDRAPLDQRSNSFPGMVGGMPGRLVEACHLCLVKTTLSCKADTLRPGVLPTMPCPAAIALHIGQ